MENPTTAVAASQNKGQYVVNYTPQEQMTAEDIHFVRLLADGWNITTAYRESHPLFKNKSYPYTRKKALELYNRADTRQEIDTVIKTKAKLARLSEDRLEEILTEMRPNKTVADVSMFLYDHANGKATQRIESVSKSISVNIDLTGKVADEQEREHRQARADAQA